MAFVPKDAKWYLADIVMEITVDGDPRNVVHTNYTLVRADSPEEAYQAALKLGAAQEISYENSDGLPVRFRFRGLRSLNVVFDEDLKHGTELSYYEDRDMEEQAILDYVTPKDQLGVFAPAPKEPPNKGLDYGSREILEKMRRERPDLFDEQSPVIQ